MKTEDAQRYAEMALDVAKRAGDIAAQGYRKRKVVKTKSGNELVTEFDMASETFIRQELASLTPSFAIIAEEMGGARVGERIWYVDPIDGTTNFAHGHPFWAVSIGLVVRGVPIAGAVVAPALGSEWVGWMGGQARRNDELCQVSETDSLQEAFLATGFPYDRTKAPENNFDTFMAIKRQVNGVRRCGSAALDMCLVADGTYDGYWEGQLRPWDTAAGIAIVSAAGGMVTSFENGAPDVHAGQVIATNGRIHTSLVQAVRQSRKLGAL